MIRNQWYVVLESREIPYGKPIGATRLGERLVFYRDGKGRVACLRDACAHRGASLSLGKIVDREGGRPGPHSEARIKCPFHGLEYDPMGRCVRIPANGKDEPVDPRYTTRSYETFEDKGFVWIFWGDSKPASAPLFFDDLQDPAFRYATAIDPWKAHYSRVIENQLDVVHLPFVHWNTIGRGNKTVVDGPGLEWSKDGKMFVYVYNRLDDGTKPRKPSEVPIPNPNGFKLEFIFPNLWQNRIAEKVRVLAAFVPVDPESTLLYLRFYQRFLPVAGLGRLVAKMAMPYNLRVAHQDRRVVETQLPKPSSYKSGEKLIQGDLPIIEYRRRRQELIDAENMG
jgi:phenylpropionate dioxygenase-like ring-hydroxylating dioxygenase large terminal subunit